MDNTNGENLSPLNENNVNRQLSQDDIEELTQNLYDRLDEYIVSPKDGPISQIRYPNDKRIPRTGSEPTIDEIVYQRLD